jgi:hypothetical protein
MRTPYCHLELFLGFEALAFGIFKANGLLRNYPCFSTPAPFSPASAENGEK